MGWDFVQGWDRARAIREVTGPNFYDKAYKPLAHRVVGNNVWIVLQGPEGKQMSLVMLKGHRGYGYGYKSLLESMGPYEVNCPLSLLAQCDPPMSEWSAEWRKRVEKFHADAKERKKCVLEPGQVLVYGGARYRLISKAGPRGSWFAYRTSDQKRFRFGPRHINASTLVAHEEATA